MQQYFAGELTEIQKESWKCDDGIFVLTSEAMAEIREREAALSDIIMKKNSEITELKDQLALLNPCGHTGFESVSCEACGYPDSRKVIVGLKAELKSHNETESDKVAKLSRLTALVNDDERAERVIRRYECSLLGIGYKEEAINDYRAEIKREGEI